MPPKEEQTKADEPKKENQKVEQPKAQKRDNPRPFVRYEKITQVVIDDKTKKPVINPRTGKPVEAVIGYKPLLRKGGLTEEILNTGNLETLEEFWEDHGEELNEPEKEYMEARLNTAREVKRLGDASKADLAEGKTAPRPEPDEKDGFVGFSDLKYPNQQTSGNGCWSCSYSLLLKSRGIDLSQEKIRAWRPDRSKDRTVKSKDNGIQRKQSAASYRMNTDGVNGLMENADLLGQVLPNESMAQITMKPLVKDELFVDGEPVDNAQYKTILVYYKEQMKAQLTDQIRKAIQVDKSPVALAIDGHFVTITGISKDGKRIRYEDSLPANGKITGTMTMDELVHRATEVHKSWGGRTAAPNGLSLTWIRDINVPEYEKRKKEKPVIHAEEPGLVELSETGKVTVDVPTTHESANAMGDMATGQIEGKGVSYPVTLKQEELTKLMGGKPFFSVGIGGGYTMGYADVYYPGRIYYKKDPMLTNDRLAGDEAEKLFDNVEDILGGIVRNAEKNGKAGAWTEQLKEYNKAIGTLRDYAGDPEDERAREAMQEAVKKLKEFPDFLESKEGDRTVYEHLTENMVSVHRAFGIKTLLKLDDMLELKTDFGKLMGVGNGIHPNDVDYREDRNLDWLSAAQGSQTNDRDEITRTTTALALSRILAREELWAEKIAAGDMHPEISVGELNARAAKIRETENFRKMTEGDALYELAASKDTEKLQKAYADGGLVLEAPKAEEPKAGGQQAGPKAEEPKSGISVSALDPVAAPLRAPEEKKDIKAKHTLFDIQQGQWVGGSALFGLLGDTLTQKEMGSIYKKLSIMRLFTDDPDSPKVYGENYKEIAEELGEGGLDLMEREEGPKRQILKGNGIYDHYVDDRVDEPLKVWQEGMRGLGAALEKKAQMDNFASPAERNYFYVMKGFVDDINNGTFSKKYLENPAYEYAHNMTGKLMNTAPTAKIKEKDGKYIFSTHISKKTDDYRNVRLIQDTGMIDAMAGGMKVTGMLEEHLSGGDVGREELIAEYRLQQQRMEKALSISEEKFNALKAQGVFDEVYNQFSAEGARGYGYALVDARSRAEFLEAGYPASDLAAVSPFIRELVATTRNNSVASKKLEEDQAKHEADRLKLEEDQKNLPENAAPEQVKALEDRKAKLDQEKKNLDQRKAALDQQLETQKLMEETWKKVTDTAGHLTAQERREKLQELHDSTVTISGRLAAHDQLDIATHNLEQRMNARLTYSEQALMANTADALYRIVDGRNVDPMLMRSSDQFKKFKEELKNLAQMEKDLDPTDEWEVKQYQEQAAKVVQAGNDYLRYKTKQLNGSAHDRSGTEALRVSVVDGVVNSLKSAKVPGAEAPMLQKGVKPIGVTVPETGGRILGTQQKSGLPVDYDSYIRLHTGRAAANGTREEMIEDISRVMAAYMLKTAKEPVKFDLNHIHKCAEQLKSKFNLNDLDQESLSRYLGSQGNVKNVIREIRGKVYGFKNDVTYEKYLDQMRELYRQMADPAKDKRYAGDEAYKKLYEQVEKVAHLPENLDGIDQERLMEIIEGANFEILRAAQKCAVAHALDDGNRKNLNGLAGEAMDSLSVMSDLVESGSARFKATLKKVNEARGTLSFENEYLSVKYGGMAKIEPEDYGNGHFGRELRDLDENRLKAMKQTVQKSLTEQQKEQLKGALGDAKEAVSAAEQKALKGAAADAKEALKSANKTQKSQEAPESTKRPTLDGAEKKADGKKPEAQKKDAEKKEAEKQESKIKRSNTLRR